MTTRGPGVRARPCRERACAQHVPVGKAWGTAQSERDVGEGWQGVPRAGIRWYATQVEASRGTWAEPGALPARPASTAAQPCAQNLRSATYPAGPSHGGGEGARVPAPSAPSFFPGPQSMTLGFPPSRHDQATPVQGASCPGTRQHALGDRFPREWQLVQTSSRLGLAPLQPPPQAQAGSGRETCPAG